MGSRPIGKKGTTCDAGDHASISPGRATAAARRVEPTIYSREQPPESSWIRPSAAVAAGLRHRILELENSLKEARRQVITAEFAAQVDKHQITQVETLLARRQNINMKEVK
jgi:hypothetical protein